MHIATKVGTLAIGGRRFEAGVIDIFCVVFFLLGIYLVYTYTIHIYVCHEELIQEYFVKVHPGHLQRLWTRHQQECQD